jgi:hypothetical protein
VSAARIEVEIGDGGVAVVVVVRARGARGIWNPALTRVTIQCGFTGGVTGTAVTGRCAGVKVGSAGAAGVTC